MQTQDRVSLNTSKEDISNVKGDVVQTAVLYLEGLAQILGRYRYSLKFCLPQGEGVLARASLIAV